MTKINRIELIQDYMDELIQTKTIHEYKSGAYIHLFSVSQYCALLAMKRNLNTELASISGLLHDVYSYSKSDYYNHAHLGAIQAKEILENMNIFTEEEISIITQAIDHHSDKHLIHGPYDEILKDADVLSHCLLNIKNEVAPHEKERFNALKEELGIKEK